VLGKRHGPEFGEPFGRLVQDGEDVLALVDLKAEDPRVVVERTPQPISARVFVELPASHSTSSRWTGIPASVMLVGGRYGLRRAMLG
jgi:hypothetical protein